MNTDIGKSDGIQHTAGCFNNTLRWITGARFPRKRFSKNASQLGRLMEEKGAGYILFTNVDVEGLLEGFKLKPLLELLNTVNIPVIYSGGISSTEDLEELSNTDVYGVVIGSALYKGKIKFEDTLKYQGV